MRSLRVDLAGADSAEELERCTRELRRELLQTDVDSVDLEGVGPAPLGSKGLDSDSVTTLLVTLGASGGLFATALGVIQAWFQRQRRVDRVALEVDGDKLELEGELTEEKHRLIVDFMKKHQTEGS